MKKHIAFFAVLLFTSLAAAPASAEIEKFMTITNGQMRPFYRLKFTPPKGWVQEKDASKKYGLPMYVREGTDFSSSPALMYIMVSYNHQKKETLQQYIDNSNEYWRGKMKDARIEKASAEKRANGQPDFEVYRYVNPSDSNQPYELLAYGEDKDKDGNHFLMKIALSARSEKALNAAEADFRAGLRAH
jgi:hypothetical protein